MHFERLKNLGSELLSKRLPRTALNLEASIRNLKIGDKLNLGFGILTVLTFLVIGRSFLSSLQARVNINRTEAVRMPMALTSLDAQTNLLKMLSNVRGYLATGESEFRDRYQQSRQDFEGELTELDTLLDGHTSPDSQRRLDDLQKTYTEWTELPDRLFRLHDNLLENQPALKILDAEGETLIAGLLADTQKLLKEQEGRSLSVENTALLREIVDFQSSYALMVAMLRSYLVTREPSFRFEYAANVKANQASWEKLNRDRALFTPSQQQLLKSIEQKRQQFLKLPERMIAAVESNQYRQDLYLFQAEAEPLADRMLKLLDEMVLLQQQALTSDLQVSSASLAAAQWQILAGGCVALMLAIAMNSALRRQIAAPIKRLTAVTTRIMDGDFEVRARVESQDEIGTLATTFNQMTQYLKESHKTLEDYSRNLEQRVDERTQELQDKNEQLAQTLLDLQATQTQLIQTEKMSSLGQLVAGVAHEINNPVSFIHGNISHATHYTKDLLELLELYQAHLPSPPGAISRKAEEMDLEFIQVDLPKLMASMQVGAERIREIVRSLRVFSRLDEAEVKEVNIHEGIDSTLMILHSRLKAKPQYPEIQVIKQYGELPLVECYAGQLNQVFMNILSNAIDALEECLELKSEKDDAIACQHAPHIYIRTEQTGPNRVAIHISDNGPGMSLEVQQRLFDPFFTTKAVGKGTGLGMSISHQIITERHGGSLQCTSTVGTGTEFTIEIPIQQGDRVVL